MLKFLIADDHPLFREALITALKTEFKTANFLESDSFFSTSKLLKRHRNLTLLLLDLNMPGCEDYYGLLRIRQTFPELPIVVVTASDDVETVAEVMEFGANGFIPKTSATRDMVDGLKKVLAGETYVPASMVEELSQVSETTKSIAKKVKELTPKQFQVLRLLKMGLKNKDIATNLDVTEATVKAHISTLFKRLDVKSRTQILVVVEKLHLEL